MGNLKSIKTSSSIQSRELSELAEQTGNVYEALAIIAKRANQMNVELTEELKEKLHEFSSTTDNLEEIHENLEQIEISKYYEKLQKPVLLALQEYKEGSTYFRRKEEE